jgi:CRISPR type III-B/RAMP module RAMP protein Cmr6
MREPEERFTLPGTKLPTQELPPTLLFHRWQRYDCFWPDWFTDERNKRQALTPFKRNFTAVPFLDRIADAVQAACRADYATWHRRYSSAFVHLQIEPVLRATTIWRLVVGWGTNPTFETGVTLDHLLGFPFIPGSAVKGLLHRVAEQELLETPDGVAAIPPVPETLPAEPSSDLKAALDRARRVRVLFGSLHLRHDRASDPEAPYDRLAGWLDLMSHPDAEREPWIELRRQLARLCSDAPAGGMVTCFDAVPDPRAFIGKQARVLTPDVLTPHPLDASDRSGPNPIPFLAVRDGLPFELRYRLAAWPAARPRDEEERERASDLAGIDRETVATQLHGWLVGGLAELGLGGKTSAGYGYLLAEGTGLPQPKLLAKKEWLSESELLARTMIPDDLSEDRAIAALDNALGNPDRALQGAVAARFTELFPEAVEKWRTSLRAATRKRVEAIDRLLGEPGKEEP